MDLQRRVRVIGGTRLGNDVLLALKSGYMLDNEPPRLRVEVACEVKRADSGRLINATNRIGIQPPRQKRDARAK